MYTSAFTFAKRDYDDEFHALDNVIAQIARSIPGYLGEESWENAATGLIGGPTLTHISTLVSGRSTAQVRRRSCRTRSASEPSTVLVVRDGARGWPRRCGIGVGTFVFLGSLVTHTGGG